ncbi:FAD-dependent monooxygenase [Lichenibacterium dinghuense]|uniref:FAD-dependent monooxygenase n=1 Tax=Lichenibacterium dinghuense TaxID=2895977 RepID=UPI001F02D396|nr:FAD-dependent monooxygenase [Lichenibacterium sp. 6Y81]
MSASSTIAETAEVAMVGAGAVGLSLGIALARSGVTVVLVGPIDARPTGRTVALLEGSVQFLARLGVWEQLRLHAEPLRVMRLVDDTGSLFRGPPLDFDAREIGRDCFGFNIQNHLLVEALAEAARAVPGLTLRAGRLDAFAFGPDRVVATGPEGLSVSGAVLVATDGRRSAARKAAGIGAREVPYPQDAITTTLHHDRPHRNVSTEFHTRAGPFTLVPLPGTAEAPHRSSLVWGMAPDDAERRAAYAPERLARDVERQSRMLLGRVRVAGAVGRFPIGSLTADRLVGPRLALAGEAAHAMAPIGAQGLNLSLRDAAALAEVLSDAKRGHEDLGSPAVLDRYARTRHGDIAARSFGVDWLNRSILDDRLTTDLLRGAGLLAMGSIGPLRRFAMRQGLMPGAEARPG